MKRLKWLQDGGWDEIRATVLEGLGGHDITLTAKDEWRNKCEK